MKLLPGFRFEERMSGHYHLLTGPPEDRPIEFTMTARARSLPRFLRKPVAEIEGEADLRGFADHKPARGTMLLDLLAGRRIGYDFEFPGNDGHTYRFKGQKDVELGRLRETMSTLPAGLFDGSGTRIGEATVHFHYSTDLVRFLRSWRLA